MMLCLILMAFVAACSDKSQDVTPASQHEMVERATQYYNKGNLNNSFSVLLDVVANETANEGVTSPEDFVNGYFLLGNCYFAHQDYVTALRYYHKALKKARETGRQKMGTKLLFNITISNSYLGNFLEAEQTRRELMEVSRKAFGDTMALYNDILSSAVLDKASGHPNDYVNKMRALLTLIDSTSDNRRLRLSPVSELTEYYQENGQPDSVLYFLREYDLLASEYNVPNMIVDCKRQMMGVYAEKRDLDKLLETQQAYFAMVDSLDLSRFLTIQGISQTNKEQQFGEKIRTLQYRVSLQQIVLLIILIVTALVGLWLFFRSRSEKILTLLFRRDRQLARMEELTETSPPPGSEIAADDARSQLYVRILETMEKEKPYCNPDFSLQMLADMVGSNTKYVSAAINDVSGKNFRSFINEYRIRVARERLADMTNYGNLTIQSIAESVGFVSQSAFHVAFKKITGMTPAVYQRMARKESGKDSAKDSAKATDYDS